MSRWGPRALRGRTEKTVRMARTERPVVMEWMVPLVVMEWMAKMVRRDLPVQMAFLLLSLSQTFRAVTA